MVEEALGNTPVTPDAAVQAAEFRETFACIKKEVHRVFVGHDDLVDMVLSVLLSDGHVLLEGVPGIGKTLLSRTVAAALSMDFSRIQFTPDLMPADVVGTMVLHEMDGGGHELKFQQGPIVANFVLADEINRATPKTQSALLEAMQERQVSVGTRTLRLPEPYVVMATQNPVEQEGTYPLPEAQLDRFLVKLTVGYPQEDEYLSIIQRTTGADVTQIEPVCSAEKVLEMRKIVRSVPVSDQVSRYVVRLVMATQPDSAPAPEKVRKFVALGSSPRGAQALILLAKVRALLDGRFAVSCQDVRDVALPVLRHRLLLNFEGLASHTNPDDLVRVCIDAVPELSN